MDLDFKWIAFLSKSLSLKSMQSRIALWSAEFYEGILVSDVKDQEVVKGNELFEDKEGTKALERATIQVELVFINVFDDKFVNI